MKLSVLAATLFAALTLNCCVQADQAVLQNGTVLAAVPVDQAGDATGAGAVAGAVILGTAGAAVGGRGAGQILAVAAGAVVGASAGSAIEASGVRHDGMAYTIRLADGSVVTVAQHLNEGDPVFAVGAGVTLQTRGREQRVMARGG